MNKWLLSRLIAALLLAMLTPTTLIAGTLNNLDDLFMGVWSPFGRNWERSTPVCMNGDADNSEFRVRVTSLNNPTQYTLENNIGTEVRYKVYWYNNRLKQKREILRPNQESRHLYTFNDAMSCSSGASAKLRVQINNRDIKRAEPGIYSDTIVLTLSPL